MPFTSKAQSRFMFSQKPQMAKEFAAKTPNMKALPEKAKKKGKGKKSKNLRAMALQKMLKEMGM